MTVQFPAVSRAMVIRAAGELPVEVEREVPEPGPGEVLVRVGGSSMNYHDLVNLLGLLPGPLPRSPLSDGAGEVVAVGDGVGSLRVGDRVSSTFHPDWLDGPPTPQHKRNLPGDTTDGWLRQHACVRATGVVPAPSHLTDPQAATLVCAGVTAWSSLEAADIGPGDTVVTLGTGGVSLFTVQLAQARGARVILTSSSDEKLALGGADEGVNYRATPEWQDEVRRLTDGRGADLVVDLGGQDTLGRSVRAARMGGTVAIVGVLGGVGNAEVPVSTAMMNNIHLVGITVGSVADHTALSRFVTEHGIVPHVSHTLGWDELPEAMRLMQANEHVGKIAITVP
jgi:NADPH:quinone reductase-like Zn-dependent oxidoreductase